MTKSWRSTHTRGAFPAPSVMAAIATVASLTSVSMSFQPALVKREIPQSSRGITKQGIRVPRHRGQSTTLLDGKYEEYVISETPPTDEGQKTPTTAKTVTFEEISDLDLTTVTTVLSDVGGEKLVLPNVVLNDIPSQLDNGRDEYQDVPVLKGEGEDQKDVAMSAMDTPADIAENNAIVAETVNAILAASEEAAAAADASLFSERENGVGANNSALLSTMEDDTLVDTALPSSFKTEIVPASVAVSEEAKAMDTLLDESAMNPQAIPTIVAPKKDGESTQAPQQGPVADTIEAPRVGKILKFAVPAIGVWLCGPLLSLIDTSSVGILSGTVQQAALNPAVAVTDYAALLIAFLYTGTTNLMAAARELDRTGATASASSPRSTRTLIGALQFSTYVGAGLGLALFVFARTLLRTIIGNDGISPAVFDAAMKYVRIRALGMPAAAVIGSAQAACLGMQDIRSPLYVLVAAAAVNFLGDMSFVGCANPWIGGAAGAAWATVISQYAAVGLFMRWLCNKPRIAPVAGLGGSGTGGTGAKGSNKKAVVNLSNAILELTGKPSSAGESRRKRFRDALTSFRSSKSRVADSVPAGKVVGGINSGAGEVDRTSLESESSHRATESAFFTRGSGRLSFASRSLRMFGRKLEENSKDEENVSHVKAKKSKEESFSVRGFLDGRFRPRELVRFPSRETVKEFAPYVAPVTSTQVGRVSGYVAMSHVVSSSLGTVSMAAQQVIVSLFYCLCPIADSLSLTAQSFVPAISEKQVSRDRALALRKTAVNFLKAGAVFGAVMVAAVCCIPLLSGFFTSDPTVVSLVNMVAPLLVGVFTVHGVVCSAEGLLLGQKDLGFLGKLYALYFAVVPYFMFRVKRAALSGSHVVNLTSVWKVFLGYQLARCFLWVGRVAILQRRTDREAHKLAAP